MLEAKAFYGAPPSAEPVVSIIKKARRFRIKTIVPMCKDAAKKMPPQNSNVDFCEKKKRRRKRYTVRDDVVLVEGLEPPAC